uniref:Uncharacterized protein n=1 Tax=Terrapene triunguis TaxID=2587831 RepID=A0A674IP61_9SAUR
METCCRRVLLLVTVAAAATAVPSQHKTLSYEEAIALAVDFYNQGSGIDHAFRLLKADPQPEWVSTSSLPLCPPELPTHPPPRSLSPTAPLLQLPSPLTVPLSLEQVSGSTPQGAPRPARALPSGVLRLWRRGVARKGLWPPLPVPPPCSLTGAQPPSAAGQRAKAAGDGGSREGGWLPRPQCERHLAALSAAFRSINSRPGGHPGHF